MGDDLLLRSSTVVPMLTSEWQTNQHSDSGELRDGAGTFVFDGNFVVQPMLLGEWKAIGEVPAIENFTPGKGVRPSRIGRIVFKSDGRTDSVTRIWSGHTLMDLSSYQALKMKLRRISDEDYLFIEVGGFSSRNPAAWQSPWHVLERHSK